LADWNHTTHTGMVWERRIARLSGAGTPQPRVSDSDHPSATPDSLLFMRVAQAEMVRGHCGRNPARPTY
jgi:hypothetical protein